MNHICRVPLSEVDFQKITAQQAQLDLRSIWGSVYDAMVGLMVTWALITVSIMCSSSERKLSANKKHSVKCVMIRDYYREARKGWPLLTVETEVNRDSKRTNDRGPSLVGSLVSSFRYNRFLSCLCCPSQPSTKIISLAVHFSSLLESLLGRRSAGSPVSVSLVMIHRREWGRKESGDKRNKDLSLLTVYTYTERQK